MTDVDRYDSYSRVSALEWLGAELRWERQLQALRQAADQAADQAPAPAPGPVPAPRVREAHVVNPFRRWMRVRTWLAHL